MVLKSSRSAEGSFLGKYVKTPLDEESKGVLEGSEAFNRQVREYLTEKVNEHEWG